MLEQFELVKEKCTLFHVNVRTELHGEERRPAYDLKFYKDFPNAILGKLHPDLLDTFYRADKQADIEANYKPVLKFGLMGAVSWELEIPRTKLTIHDPDGHDLVIAGGKTNKFKFQMLDGGTVKMSFRCQFSQVEEDDIAKLLRALNESVPVSLACEAVEEKLDNFEQADLLSQEPMSEARKEAESVFSAPPTDMQVGDVVDAEFVPPVEATNVAPIKGRKPKRAAGGANLE